LDSLTNVSGHIVHRNSPLNDQLFHLQPGAKTCLGENFVQFGRLGLGQQDALGDDQILIFNVLIKLS
jgi:hypothetical protein